MGDKRKIKTYITTATIILIIVFVLCFWRVILALLFMVLWFLITLIGGGH